MKEAAAMADELPVHPLTGLTALGVLRSGRIVWPVLGAAPEGDDDTDNDDDGTGDSGDDDQDGDDLGAAGKKALKAERDARKAETKARKAAEAKAADLEARLAAAADGKKDDDADKARRDAEAAADAKANTRILAAEVKAAAAGKLADPSDAARYLDLTQFALGDDGEFDAEEIAEAISDLIKKKPYLAAKATGFQGSGDGGARTGGSGPKQLTRSDIKNMTPTQIEKARQEGRLEKLLSGS